jgi:DHA1 family inner membrane transport protein
MNIGAFNLGNAIGAAVGGSVISLGGAYPLVSLAGAAMSGLGLTAALLARTGDEGSRERLSVCPVE